MTLEPRDLEATPELCRGADLGLDPEEQDRCGRRRRPSEDDLRLVAQERAGGREVFGFHDRLAGCDLLRPPLGHLRKVEVFGIGPVELHLEHPEAVTGDRGAGCDVGDLDVVPPLGQGEGDEGCRGVRVRGQGIAPLAAREGEGGEDKAGVEGDPVLNAPRDQRMNRLRS
jgi:hypothetical protein